jgi:AcrR family transcriptional regulator
MTPPKPDPRQRLVAGAADMLRRRGLNATSVRELAKHAKAPLGSTYHYFPGGKPQLVTEAVRYAGDLVGRGLRKALQAGPVEGLRAFLGVWREVITSSDFQAGCPVLAVCVEEPSTSENAAALTAAAEVFSAWAALLAESMRQHGAEARHADQLATLIIAAVEGTVAMCRANASAGPLDQVSAQLETLVRAAIAR